MADAKEHHEIIIVKHHDDEEHEHHSSAWKVAHADFMTAMMAFFLIMWLINVTDEEVRKGIAAYFNPLHITEGQTEHKGLNDPDATEAATETVPGKAPPVKSAAGGPAEEASAHPPEDAGGNEDVAEGDGEGTGAPEAVPGDPKSTRIVSGDLATFGPADEAVTDDRERAAFQDPYALLASLASEYKAKHPASADIVVGDSRNQGLVGGEADRDPFDPIYWQTAEVPDVRAASPGEAGTNAAIAPEAQMDAAGAEPLPEPAAAEPAAMEPPSEPVAEAPAPPPPPAPPVSVAAEPARDAGPDAGTLAVAADVGAALTSALEETLGDTALPGIHVTATSEGVLIDLLDKENFSMFAIGSAVPDGKVVLILEQVARVLAAQPGPVIVRGHTDGRPFRSPDYDNWRLSAARAHMAYYMLARGGLDEQRVVRIEGYADRELKNPADPYAAENRRIEILLRGETP